MKLMHISLIALIIFSYFPCRNYAQAPVLGTSSGFVLFTVEGAFGNTGAITYLTGDIGTNAGALTGFPPGTVAGQMYVADAVSEQAALDVISAYNHFFTLSCDSIIATTLGSGQTLKPFVYCMGAASILIGNLTLDGEGNPDAVFIFKIDGAFSTSVHSNIILINSASLCNVYWQVNGKIDMGDSTVFYGTIIATGAINILEGSSLMGRGFSTAGAIALNNNIVSNGMPVASVISADGAVTFFTGDSVVLSGNNGGIWSNAESTPAITIKTSGDYYVTNTDCCDSINSNHIIVSVSLPVVLLSFNATVNANNVQLNWQTSSEINNDYFTVLRSPDGSTFEKIINISGAGYSNSELSYSYSDYIPFSGISYYRLMQTDFDGKYVYSSIIGVEMKEIADFNIYPNPYRIFTNIFINDASENILFELRIFNISGELLKNMSIITQNTIIETSNLPAGVYFFNLLKQNKIIYSGKITSLCN
jgi:hypothetical protein